MGWSQDTCPHPAWQPTASPMLERCTGCSTLRHKAFESGTGGRTRTFTKTVLPPEKPGGQRTSAARET